MLAGVQEVGVGEQVNEPIRSSTVALPMKVSSPWPSAAGGDAGVVSRTRSVGTAQHYPGRPVARTGNRSAPRAVLEDVATPRSTLLSFPDPVDEVSARLVAGGVVAMVVAAVAFDWRWLVALLAYGFVARVLTGPRLSPLGLVVTRVVRPRLDVAARPVPGPPKRFAQGIGVVFSVTALVLALAGAWGAAQVVLVLLGAAAFLESAFGLCLGCKGFAVLMRAGVIPDDVCERCNDIWATG